MTERFGSILAIVTTVMVEITNPNIRTTQDFKAKLEPINTKEKETWLMV
jgi:hypothetical protein